MKYIALQEIKLQLRGIVLWVWIVILFVDIFYFQLGYYYLPFLEWEWWRGGITDYGNFVRLFFDYAGLEFYTFSIFIAGFILYKDKKHNFYDIIHSKQIKPSQYIIGRYCGIIILYIILIIMVSVVGFLFYQGGELSNTIDGLFMFCKYGLYLLLPTMMFTIAVYFLLYIISNGYLLPVVVYFITYIPVVWQGNIRSYAFKILIRLNIEHKYEIYIQHQNTILINRICVFLLSFVILGITIKLCRNGFGEKKNIKQLLNIEKVSRKKA